MNKLMQISAAVLSSISVLLGSAAVLAVPDSHRSSMRERSPTTLRQEVAQPDWPFEANTEKECRAMPGPLASDAVAKGQQAKTMEFSGLTEGMATIYVRARVGIRPATRFVEHNCWCNSDRSASVRATVNTMSGERGDTSPVVSHDGQNHDDSCKDGLITQEFAVPVIVGTDGRVTVRLSFDECHRGSEDGRCLLLAGTYVKVTQAN